MTAAAYILAIEYENHCDLIRIPVSRYAQVAFALNQLPCRYWIHYEDYPGHKYRGPTYVQLG